MSLTDLPSTEVVVSVTELSRQFGSNLVLDEVSLVIRRGQVLGLVGPNGAGKTTLIKHLLGLLKAESGRVRVFGLDPVSDPAAVLGRVGYLSEDRDLPPWMRVDELLRYSRAFYPRWDDAYAEALREKFQLKAGARLKQLSRGELAKASLLVALSHRPDLLILDEPSSGLDPLVRREILEAIVRTVAREGRTVLLSSHFLDEVERVADQIAMLNEGRVVLSGSLADILDSHQELSVRFPRPLENRLELTGALSIEGAGLDWAVLCNGRSKEVLDQLGKHGGQVVDRRVPSLEEIFRAHAALKREAARRGAQM
jgi:ABC-2 type transport system ATP-binding protein